MSLTGCLFECVLLDILVSNLREMYGKWPVATCYFLALLGQATLSGSQQKSLDWADVCYVTFVTLEWNPSLHAPNLFRHTKVISSP